MLSLLVGGASLVGFLTVTAAIINAPLVLLVFLARRRLGRLSSALLAAGFGGATADMIWRMEWFDVWRHGVAPVGYLLTSMVPYTAIVAAVGWFLGRCLPRKQAP